MTGLHFREWPRARLNGLLGLAVALAFLASLAAGPAGAGIVTGLLSGGTGDTGMAQLILQEIRLPRAILGVAIGGVLGLSGAALQGFLRNPLAEPGLLGVSAGASFGAVISFYFGLATMLPLALPLGGIAGAFGAVALLYALAGQRSGTLTLILAGLAISSLATALTSLALNLAPSPWAALEIIFWIMGSLSDRSLNHVLLALPLMLAGAGLLVSTGRALDALTLGNDAAETMGFGPRRVALRIVAGTAMAVGAAVAVAGAIGFVGLVVPHLLRPLVGHRPSRLLIPSALGGAALLTLADVAVRLLPGATELRLGVVTALIGAPFFLSLVLKARREQA